MHHIEHLRFLQQKIQELGSAIFYNLSDAVLKLPTCLISKPAVDDFGFVWTWVPRPKQSIAEFENGFPVRLDFYCKGSSCFLKVSGTAWIVTDPEELYALPVVASQASFMLQQMIPVKVKMLCAEYHEAGSVERHSWWERKAATLGSWFRHPQGNYAASGEYSAVS